jgi:hypothetical protein
MNINVINESSKGLPQELLTAISSFKDFDRINDIAEAWNLKVVNIKFNYTVDEKLESQEITIGDSF